MSGPHALAALEQHWDSIYAGNDPDDLRWHEAVPATLPLVLAHSAPADAVIDIGGGASHLVGHLLDRVYTDLTVLDVSETALDHARGRVGLRGDEVEWLHADITVFEPPRRWRLWHDRAVFHFLVDDDDRAAYRRAAAAGIAPGGVLVVATFAPDGPEMCARPPGAPLRRRRPRSRVRRRVRPRRGAGTRTGRW